MAQCNWRSSKIERTLTLFRRKQNLRKMNPEFSLIGIIPFFPPLAFHAESIIRISLQSLLFNPLCW